MIAIYTPTFNRAKELTNLYKSLCIQKNKDFFWLIIDDGSIDNTKEVVRAWILENKIEIRYIKKKNGGKHTALNLALDTVDEYWNLCIDSDDWLLDDKSVGKIIDDIERFGLNEKFISLVYPYKFENHEFEMINRNPKEVVDFNLRNEKLNILEATIVSRPKAYKNIRFPIIEGEKFMAEGAIEIPKLFKGKRLYINDPIVEGRYLPGGLSQNIVSLWRKNPEGYFYVRNLGVKYYNHIGSYVKFLKPSGQMIAYNIDQKRSLLEGIDYKILGIFSIPFGMVYWLKKFKNS